MGNHKLIKEMIFELYDGELSPEKKGQVSAHLEDCAECRSVLGNWKKVAAVFLKAGEVSPPDLLVERVMERITDAPSPSQALPEFFGWRWLAPALGLGFAVLFFTLIFKGMEEPVSTETLLLVDGREAAVTDLAFGPAQPKTNDVLGYVLEGL